MSGAFAIYRRELSALFGTPLAWILLAGTLLLNGYLLQLVLEEVDGDVTVTLMTSLGARGSSGSCSRRSLPSSPWGCSRVSIGAGRWSIC